MKYINHLTFNSGDCIKNIPQGMEGEFLEILKKIVEDAQTEKLADVEDDETGAVLKLEFLNEDCYIATLYNNRTDRIPMLCDLLFKGIALNPEAAIWSGSFTNALAWTIFANKIEQKKAS